MATPAEHGRVLVVCTGNVCRSPYIERALAADVGPLGIDVGSAGTRALVGEPIDPGSRRLLSASGISSDGFAARQLTAVHVASSDLVICATREHAGDVARLHPRALRYAFALRDLGDLLATVIPEELAAAQGANAVARVVAAAVARRGTVAPRPFDQSGIYDPFRQSAAAFDRMAREIAASLPPVTAALTAAVAGAGSRSALPDGL